MRSRWWLCLVLCGTACGERTVVLVPQEGEVGCDACVPAQDSGTNRPDFPEFLSQGSWASDQPGCTHGGSVLQSGYDRDGDKLLDPDEVMATSSVCAELTPCVVEESATQVTVTCPNQPAVVVDRPEPGMPGVMTQVKPAGNECPNGGFRVETGHDADGDQALTGGEVEGLSWACAPYCGDGTTDPGLGEGCDDGNSDDQDGCAACHVIPDCAWPDPDEGCPAFEFAVTSAAPISGPTQGGTQITLSGAFPSVTTAANVEVVRSGSTTPLTVVDASSSRIRFLTPAGSGLTNFQLRIAGKLVEFQRYVQNSDGRTEVALENELAFAYDAPVINKLTGCEDHPPATTHCPDAGGTTITIDGHNFGSQASDISVMLSQENLGDVPCTQVALVEPHTKISCTLPAYTRYEPSFDVKVQVASRTSEPAPLLAYAGIAVVPGTLHLEGAEPTSPLLLSDVTGVYDLVFDVSGLSNAQSALVRVGSFPCTGVGLVHHDGSDLTTVSCSVGPAAGADLPIVVRDGDRYSPPSEDRINYPAPKIIAGTIRGALADDLGETSFSAQASQGDRVFFDVENVFDKAVTPPLFSAHVGPYACDRFVIHDGSPATAECQLPLGWGGPYHITVSSRGQDSEPGTDSVSFPDTPTIVALAGCPGGTASATGGCSTEGGMELSVTVDHLDYQPGDPLSVWLGSAPCSEPRVSLPLPNNAVRRRIYCTVPPGLGNAAARVIWGLKQSPPAALFAYGSPTIDSLSGCTDQGDTTLACPRNGGVKLTIQGENFGASGAQVRIGEQNCLGVAHDVLTPHRKLTCTLPSGSGQNVPVWVVNGGSGGEAFYMSYAPAGG
ncbi:MAG: IPT/TIG domain-containing protein [Myxococcales bacterium]